MHTLTFILLIKLVKLCVVTQKKKNLVKKYRKKKSNELHYTKMLRTYIDIQRIWWVKKVWAFQICNVVRTTQKWICRTYMYLKHATARTSPQREEELRKKTIYKAYIKRVRTTAFFFFWSSINVHVFLKIFFPFKLLDIASQLSFNNCSSSYEKTFD